MAAMTRPQEHLSVVVAEHGNGDATQGVRLLLEYGLARQLEKEIQDRIDQGKALRSYPYVSESGKCPRQLFFALTNTPKTEPTTLDSWMTMSLGKKAEELYVQLLEAAGVRIITQERVELKCDGETIVGKLDLLLEIPDSVRNKVPGLDPVELWEIKAKNTRAMSWMIKRGGPDADDGYVKQIRSYLHGAVLGWFKPAPTNIRGRLVYTATGATKGEPVLQAYWVPYSRDEVTKDLKILAQAMKGARDGNDPGIPLKYADAPNWPCSYCSWRGKCFPRRVAK